MAEEPILSISIVSHGHDDLIELLMRDIAALPDLGSIELLLTENIPGNLEAITARVSLACRLIRNSSPHGFGWNHNQAFRMSRGRYFAIINPDLRIEDTSLFGTLVQVLRERPGVAGPRVVTPDGRIEDSARHVPSFVRLFERTVLGRKQPDYASNVPLQSVDWLAGMCLIFDRESYELLGGFDDGYFLYCEDVDICLRTHLAGRAVSWVQTATVVHDARRKSLKSMRHFLWHIASMVRLLLSPIYRKFTKLSATA
ncbi:Rhamnosyltransferase WbbL [compost metagenome]